MAGIRGRLHLRSLGLYAANAHADANERLEGGRAIDQEILIPLHNTLLEKDDKR